MDFVGKRILILTLLAGVVFGCRKDDDDVKIQPNNTTPPDNKVLLDNEVNGFVWSAMNRLYYWQSDVPELSDDKALSGDRLNEFLNSYNTPESLFEKLTHEDDRFSFIVDDYEKLEASFQGISKSFGYKFRLIRFSSSDSLLAFVEYVIPDGPADSKGLMRGDIYTKVDGTQLTIGNYRSLLNGKDSYTIELSETLSISDFTITPTGEEISLVAVELTENPILLSKVIDVKTTKVGYLVYNQFIFDNAYHEELNDVFGKFNTENISDLVLDLRYNGGGSVTTTRILASMLYDKASSNDILGSIVFNEKLNEFNTNLLFFSQLPVYDENRVPSFISMNRIDLDRIFILTSGNTASASEFIIAGLLPYMDVTIIGTKTVGKNVGSTTIYDSEDFSKSETLNKNHKYAIQPIISQIANSEGLTDYTNGFLPNIVVDESNFLSDLKQLGDLSEPLLSEALAIISGTARTVQLPDNSMMTVYDLDVRDNVSNTTLIEDEYIPKFLRKNIIEGQ